MSEQIIKTEEIDKENEKDWSIEEIKELISEYETNPELWDVSLPNYSNR